jgi:hypothetical protein
MQIAHVGSTIHIHPHDSGRERRTYVIYGIGLNHPPLSSQLNVSSARQRGASSRAAPNPHEFIRQIKESAQRGQIPVVPYCAPPETQSGERSHAPRRVVGGCLTECGRVCATKYRLSHRAAALVRRAASVRIPSTPSPLCCRFQHPKFDSRLFELYIIRWPSKLINYVSKRGVHLERSCMVLTEIH